jgi:Ca2+-binding EF-hand superfamily protein
MGMGDGPPPMMMRVMFALVDADGSGGLSLEEVQTAHARLFAAADADDDGELTPREMRRFMHAGGRGGVAPRMADDDEAEDDE